MKWRAVRPNRNNIVLEILLEEFEKIKDTAWKVTTLAEAD